MEIRAHLSQAWNRVSDPAVLSCVKKPRRRQLFGTLLLLLGSALPVAGYIRGRAGPNFTHRPDHRDIQFHINDSTRPGLTNDEGEIVITAGSDPIGALRAAFQTWSQIAVAEVNFAEPELTGRTAGFDGVNVISFADSAEARSLIGAALAVTQISTRSGGVITETDILFNPDVVDNLVQPANFSTTLARLTFDLQSVATHQLGHALGALHTNVQGATMFPSVGPAEAFARTLSDDDIAFLVDAYPERGVAGLFGRIQGRVTFRSGEPVKGGLVAAVDPATGVAIGTLTDLTGGRYVIEGVPPGHYFVSVEPLDGPLVPEDVSLLTALVTTPFPTALAGGNASPSVVPVAAGVAATADIQVEEGESGFDIKAVGLFKEFLDLGTPQQLGAASTVRVAIVGVGMGEVEESNIEFVGPGVAKRSGSFLREGVRFSVEIDLPSEPELIRGISGVTHGIPGSALITIMVRRGEMAAVATGAFVLEGLPKTPVPAFSADGVVNAASFSGNAVAPGEIVSLFGSNVGPDEPVAPFSFNENGRLPTALGGVGVSFGGVPAPLFFVSQKQLNLQVPFELAGQEVAAVVVSVSGPVSEFAPVRVEETMPGIFTAPDSSQSVALNQDGSLNSSDNPERPGAVVVVFATGQGRVEPPLSTGQPAPGEPLSRAQAATATIGGLSATVLFAGMTPGFVGLMQVNAEIPPAVAPGPQVPLEICVGVACSQPGVTLAVSP